MKIARRRRQDHGMEVRKKIKGSKTVGQGKKEEGDKKQNTGHK